MKCLKNNDEIGSEQWRRHVKCDCANCEEFFRKLRTGEVKLDYTSK
jgi:hypothetical protein